MGFGLGYLLDGLLEGGGGFVGAGREGGLKEPVLRKSESLKPVDGAEEENPREEAKAATSEWMAAASSAALGFLTATILGRWGGEVRWRKRVLRVLEQNKRRR